MKLPLLSARLSARAAATAVSQVGLISAPLGVLLDNQHGLFGVLTYAPIGGAYELADAQGHVLVRSAAWVPLLFAFAGIAMSAIQLAADALLCPHPIPNSDPTNPILTLNPTIPLPNPSPPKVLFNISLFSAQYYLSGLLDHAGADPLAINALLSVAAVAGFYYFDGSTAGLLLAFLTAIAGPAAEIFLVNGPRLYTYTHADALGVASWIPAVYFLGASAVGNLARACYCNALAAGPSPCFGTGAGTVDPFIAGSSGNQFNPTPTPTFAPFPAPARLSQFRTLIGSLYGLAGLAHLADALAGDGALLRSAGVEPFASLGLGARAAVLVWCLAGPAAWALSRGGRASADLGLLLYGIVEVGCAAVAAAAANGAATSGGADIGYGAVPGALGVQVAVTLSWLWAKGQWAGRRESDLTPPLTPPPRRP